MILFARVGLFGRQGAAGTSGSESIAAEMVPPRRMWAKCGFGGSVRRAKSPLPRT
ncbi:hypothetical protein RSSM_05823 [Rhodopirellula sallentina SM41]|uniref:Uncharacterized protein n=1 Tax=Rhodopirellula sallentina SM41 TaxID=1263870 RepID=M5TU75_9BACT|nr:hypothetical protein RSSM_05823 [Rhodopirellula sallentina SM41]